MVSTLPMYPTMGMVAVTAFTIGLKRWCKTQTVIRLEDDKPGEFRTYKRPYDPEFAQRIRSEEPKLVEILNERYI
jgi:hypothetical protein